MSTHDKSTATVRFLRKEQARLEEEVLTVRAHLEDTRRLCSEEVSKAREQAEHARRYAIVLAQLAGCAHHMLSAGETALADGILSCAQLVETAMFRWPAPKEAP